MSKGYLTVQVTAGNEAVPVSNATVKVLQDDNILYELSTDSSGSTQMVELETVARDLSLDPNYRGNPYTLYDLIVSANGYYSLHIHGIRIFEDEHAIQAVSLIPLMSISRSMQTYDIYLGPAAIQLEQEQNQEGPRIEPRILRQVIIPNPITVHLGAPTSSASNVQTSFINYVKNVASSEIYPTWPAEALKANIYAITSFALNRVYTEWYRTQGYDFDITNSTAYDQYYVYGQTIYESISKIVDEQFNKYVTRRNSTAPYFTSFCNGTTATCNGLSQWGTVTLANNGYTALDILKHYYGNDIAIAETNLITDVISSYPGTPLRLGSRGLDVQTIQVYLNRIRKNYPAIPAIKNEDGNFDGSTEASVKAFQKIFNLTADGIVGKATWNKISRIYVAVVRLAELNAEGDALGVGTVPPSSVLSLGSYGNDVLTLQYLLSYISLYYPTVSSPSSNGSFDKQTQDSVIAFQQMMGLTADGIVGNNTWNALYEVYLGIKNNTPPTPPNPDYIEYIVKLGDSLWFLANRYNTTVDAIKKLNGLSSNTIFAGQMLKIPYNNANTSYFDYTVKSGDSLWLLANRYNTTVDAIKRINSLSSDTIYVGQMLKIPYSNDNTSYFNYTVVSGDSLWLLSRRFNTTVDNIKALNNLTSDNLYIGQVLKIPQ